MAILIFFMSVFVGGLTLIMVRLSVSCMFWISKHRHNKIRVFKIYFPYYIISLFTLSVVAIIGLDKHIAAIYYFSFVFIASLLIWRYELVKGNKAHHRNNKSVVPHHPELP